MSLSTIDARARLDYSVRRCEEAALERAAEVRSYEATLVRLSEEAAGLRRALERIEKARETAPTAAEVRAKAEAEERRRQLEMVAAAQAADTLEELTDSESDGDCCSSDAELPIDYSPIRWPHAGWTYGADGSRRAGGGAGRAAENPTKGRCMVAARDVPAGELIVGDTSVYDVAASLDTCLLHSSTLRFARGFLAAARKGEARAPKSVKTRELEPGIVLMSQREQTGSDADQGFDLSPVAVTGVRFRDGLLPCVIRFLEMAAEDPDHPCWKVFDLCCPLRDVPAQVARGFVALGTELVRALRSHLPALADVLSPDRIAKLLLIVQCNSVGVRRGPYQGLALFPFASLMEHSCTPNSVVCILDETGDFGESLVEVRSLRPILRGEPICIDYNGSHQPTKVRQQQLLASHFFACRCRTCAEETDKARVFWCGADGCRLRPEHNAEAMDETLHTACQSLQKQAQAGAVVCPIGDGEGGWYSYGEHRELSPQNFADLTACSRMCQAEDAVAPTASEAVKALMRDDWVPFERLLEHSVLHPFHYLILGPIGEALIVSFKKADDPKRSLWLLSLLVRAAHWAHGPAAVEQVVEYREVAAQVWTKAGDYRRALRHREAAAAELDRAGMSRSVKGVDAAGRLQEIRRKYQKRPVATEQRHTAAP